jgi:hypothetical protein
VKKIEYTIAPVKTCWWIKDKYLDTRIRCDHIIGINRYYFRKWNCYAWCLHIGRLRISIYPFLKYKEPTA